MQKVSSQLTRFRSIAELLTPLKTFKLNTLISKPFELWSLKKGLIFPLIYLETFYSRRDVYVKIEVTMRFDSHFFFLIFFFL